MTHPGGRRARWRRRIRPRRCGARSRPVSHNARREGSQGGRCGCARVTRQAVPVSRAGRQDRRTNAQEAHKALRHYDLAVGPADRARLHNRRSAPSCPRPAVTAASAAGPRRGPDAGQWLADRGDRRRLVTVAWDANVDLYEVQWRTADQEFSDQRSKQPGELGASGTVGEVVCVRITDVSLGDALVIVVGSKGAGGSGGAGGTSYTIPAGTAGGDGVGGLQDGYVRIYPTC